MSHLKQNDCRFVKVIMDGGLAAGVEASGISLLQRAVELDTSRRFTESLICYQEGIQLLLDAMKGRHAIMYLHLPELNVLVKALNRFHVT